MSFIENNNEKRENYFFSRFICIFIDANFFVVINICFEIISISQFNLNCFITSHALVVQRQKCLSFLILKKKKIVITHEKTKTLWRLFQYSKHEAVYPVIDETMDVCQENCLWKNEWTHTFLHLLCWVFWWLNNVIHVIRINSNVLYFMISNNHLLMCFLFRSNNFMIFLFSLFLYIYQYSIWYHY